MSLAPIKIAMHGVTGRMGTNQHLVRSILAILRQGGVKLSTGEMQTVQPLLIGRNASKLKQLAEVVAKSEMGQAVEWSTDVRSVLADPSISVLFDAASTQLRPEVLKAAMQNGKAVYCEKPVAIDASTAYELAQLAAQAGIKNGVVQDKL